MQMLIEPYVAANVFFFVYTKTLHSLLFDFFILEITSSSILFYKFYKNSGPAFYTDKFI